MNNEEKQASSVPTRAEKGHITWLWSTSDGPDTIRQYITLYGLTELHDDSGKTVALKVPSATAPKIWRQTVGQGPLR